VAAAEAFQEEDHPVAGNKNLPTWLTSFVNAEGLKRIESAVELAERKTQAEIVPMIVRSSSTKGFLPFQIFLLLALFGALAVNPFSHLWFYGWIAFSLPLAVYLSRFPWVQRGLIPQLDQEADVFHRAYFEFHQKQIGETKSGTGVLIFVSLMERRAVILTDRGVAAEILPEKWNEAIQLLLSGIRKKDAALGFEMAIDYCANVLEEHIPALDNNPDEISNKLILEE